MQKEYFDIIVVGAGHAGWEAALATAPLGPKTALFHLLTVLPICHATPL